MKKTKFIIPTAIILVLIIAGIIIWNIQDKFIFYPNYNSSSDEYLKGLTDKYEEITVKTKSGERYIGWMKKGIGTPLATILCFGDSRMSSAEVFEKIDKANGWKNLETYNFIMIDYPGYGISTGKANEESIKKMSLTSVDYVNVVMGVDNVFVMGYGLGTSSALYAAANKETAGVILVAPFENGSDLINQSINIFHGPLKLLLKNSFPNDEYASQLDEDTLMIISDSDTEFSNAISEDFEYSFVGNTELITLSGVKHDELLTDTSVTEFISIFIANH